MAEFKKKDSYKLLHSPLFLCALFCIVVIFMYNMVGLIKKERETSRNKAAELAKINEFRKRQALLSTEIEKLNTPQGIEESVRDKFQVVKPGEREVLIIQDQESAQSSDTLADHSFWGYIKRLFNRKK